MTMTKELILDKQTIDKWNQLMSDDNPNYEELGIPRYSTIMSWTVDFGEGHEMDLKVCSSDTDEPLWCETVLFYNGSECECSEVYDNIDGKWILDDDYDDFVLIVKEAN